MLGLGGTGSTAFLTGPAVGSVDAANLINTRAIADIAGTAPLQVGIPATTASAVAGDIVLPNNRALRGANAAGTDTRILARLDTADVARYGNQSVAAFGLPTTVAGAAAGDVVFANSSWLRGANVAGTTTVQAIAVDTENGVRIAPATVAAFGAPTTYAGAGAGDVLIGYGTSVRSASNSAAATFRLLSLVTIGAGTDVIAINPAGGNVVALGAPATVSGAGAGDVVLANNRAFWAANAAGTGTIRLVSSDAADRVQLGAGGSVVMGLGSPAAWTGAVAGDVVMANAAWLRAANAAGTAADRVLRQNGSNITEIGGPINVVNRASGAGLGRINFTSIAAPFECEFYGGDFTTRFAAFDQGVAANDVGLYLWDFTAGILKRVSRGAVDSGGAGFRVLRVAN